MKAGGVKVAGVMVGYYYCCYYYYYYYCYYYCLSLSPCNLILQPGPAT